ncbi:MAG: helix-turn-helix transcriptional regulator [Chloroflexota bacterium]
MLKYTFAELLTIFFQLAETKVTQSEFAQQLGVSRRTVAGWFAGDYAPRKPDKIEEIAYLLCLTSLQTDLLLYSVNPDWIRYGTPPSTLEDAEVIRYREHEVSSSDIEPNAFVSAPSVSQIEREWPIIFDETFESNHQRWGEGTKKTVSAT